MRQYIDASNAVADGMPIEQVAKKYPLIADRWLNDFRYHESPEAFKKYLDSKTLMNLAKVHHNE